MIKAVFFDLYNTLVRYEPPREELQARALKDSGIEVKPELLRWPLVVADGFIYQEIARASLSRRSKAEQMAVWVQYEQILLEEAGLEIDAPLIPGLLDKMKQFDSKLVLFDDVIPALTALKSKGLLLGLISNMDRDLNSFLSGLELPSWLSVMITSLEAGVNKPNPGIFREALRRAEVPAAEAIYVGDQYEIDVVGANGAGMKGILLDRDDYFAEITDCLRLRTLTQVVEYV